MGTGPELLGGAAAAPSGHSPHARPGRRGRNRALGELTRRDFRRGRRLPWPAIGATGPWFGLGALCYRRGSRQLPRPKEFPVSDMPPPPPDDSGWSSETPPPPRDPSTHSPHAVTGWATMGTGERAELASPGARLGARLIDWIIVAIAFVILLVVGIGSAIGAGANEDEEAALSLGVLLLMPLLIAAIGVAYEVTMIALKGQTLGKMATSIKVIRADNGLLPGWGKSIGRWIIPVVLLFVPFVGVILSLLVYVSLLGTRLAKGGTTRRPGLSSSRSDIRLATGPASGRNSPEPDGGHASPLSRPLPSPW